MLYLQQIIKGKLLERAGHPAIIKMLGGIAPIEKWSGKATGLQTGL